MNGWAWAAVGVGAYFLGGIATAGYIASVGDDRVSQGLPVYQGGLASTVVLWPFALISSVGGK